VGVGVGAEKGGGVATTKWPKAADKQEPVPIGADE
jgi:hypothetical protein